MNFLDISPTGLYEVQVGPWPHIAPMPVLEASHITQIGSLDPDNRGLLAYLFYHIKAPLVHGFPEEWRPILAIL